MNATARVLLSPATHPPPRMTPPRSRRKADTGLQGRGWLHVLDVHRGHARAGEDAQVPWGVDEDMQSEETAEGEAAPTLLDQYVAAHLRLERRGS